jgi:hypothetical protein
MPYNSLVETLKETAESSDATPFELIRFPMEPDSVIRFRTEVLVVRLSDGLMRLYDRRSLAIRGSGNASIQSAAPNQDFPAGTPLATSLSVVIDGGDLVLMATGVAATNLLWSWKIESWHTFETA